MGNAVREAGPGQQPLVQQPEDEIDLRRVVGMLRRNWYLFVLGGLIGLLLGAAQLATTTRVYTAQADLVIGRSLDAETFQDFSGVGGRAAEIQIETELLVLRSERIAERVVRDLGLHEAGALPVQRPSLLAEIMVLPARALARLRAALAGDLPGPEELEALRVDAGDRAVARAVARVRGGLQVSSLRGSRVLQVRYTSPSPALSAEIANAIAAAYIQDQMESIDAASQRAIDWLGQRRDDLRVELERAMDTAERFRREHGLEGVDVDRLADAELDRLTRDLVAARAEVLSLQARDRRLTEIVEAGDTSAVVRETASQGVTATLRTRYLEALRSYNNLVATLGEDHAQTQRRQRELQETEALMFEEVRRSAQLVREDLRSARAQVASLEVAQAEIGARVGADQEILMQLRELEGTVDTLRTLQAGFQQRFQEATQRQELPVSNARLLNRAQPPGGPSAPDAQRILMLGGMFGLLFAGGLVAVREWRDTRVRSEDQVRGQLGLDYLGGLTVIRGRPHRPEQGTVGADEVSLPPILTHAADHPMSGFAETLRTGKMGLTLRHGRGARAPKIGFVSCLPAEGKTTVAANFASLAAQQGHSVMLIDADMRNPGLTAATGRSFEAGLVDVLMGDRPWREVCQRVAGTGVTLLPNSRARIAHSAELLAGQGMGALLAELDAAFDLVILDLPPLGPVVDARAVLDKLDGVFFVLKWGGTDVQLAQRVLRMDPRVRDKCYGAFLNFFNPARARAYGHGAYHAQYRRYYEEA